MRVLAAFPAIPLLAALASGPCMAQAWPGDSATGARPGNEIGTGMSLPRSDQAGNMNAATTHSELAPNLPAPVGAEGVRDLLYAARNALLAHRTGEAQEALERAETRALDRDIPAGTERIPAQGKLITGITQARDAMANGDYHGAVAILNALLRQ